MTCHQITTHWLQQEQQANLMQQLKLWYLHTEPVHPGMGCPDTPGVTETTDMDPLEEEDVTEITRHFKEDTAGINFVKGFITTKEAIQGTQVDTLRQGILQDYASTVFLGKTT